ncbi:hypothetical protein DWV06_14005 [Anaerosacchariphilus polymeriproducens]|uniref:Uncharacterized protein n=1 Tax=Anaerosacchariphilus polymeriproducens TaxID=1812858 RepID=A0A371AS69_9FIRM|nr:hypothetical protein DWV06_14005 [Anaerosacchariphilus polymeriproducens]
MSSTIPFLLFTIFVFFLSFFRIIYFLHMMLNFFFKFLLEVILVYDSFIILILFKSRNILTSGNHSIHINRSYN